MPDLRYFKGENRFLEDVWDIYRGYFFSRAGFLTQYKQIPTNERKNLFLMVASGYRLLVRNGEYHLIENQRYLYLEYLDQTYKFISIMSLIEAMFAEEAYADFYQWLTMKKRREQVFPIQDAQILDKLYREYKVQFGARKAMNFFSELDDGAQKYLAARIKIDNRHKPAEVLAQKLYVIRSEFVHQARLVLEFGDVFDALTQGFENAL